MDQETKSKSRRFQFSLKTMFLVVSVLTVPIASLAYEARLARQYRAVRNAIQSKGGWMHDFAPGETTSFVGRSRKWLQRQLGGNGGSIGVHFLRFSEVDDAALGEFVALLRPLSDVTSFSVHSADVTDDGVQCLARLQSLKRISLEGTCVTADGVATLRAALPGCEIEYGPLMICGTGAGT